MLQQRHGTSKNSIIASSLFVLLVFSATTFLPGAEEQTVVSSRGAIAAGMKALTIGLTLLFLTPSVMIRGVRRPPILILMIIGALFLLSATWSSDPARAIGKSIEYILVIFSAAAIGQYLKEMGIPLSSWLLNSVLFIIVLYFLVNLVNHGEFFHYRQLYEQDRVRLIFGENHPLVTARILYLALAAIIGRSFIKQPRTKYWIDGFLFIAIFYLLLLTNARILTGVMLLITLVWIFIKSGNRMRVMLMILFGVLMLAGVLLLLIPVTSQWIFARIDIAELLSFNGRVTIWQYAFSKFSDMPFYGFGYQAHDLFLDTSLAWVTSSHNTFIELFFSLGVFGGLLYLGLLFTNLPAVLNIRVAPLPGILIIILFIDSLFSVGLTMPTVDTITLALVGAYGVGNV